MKTFLIVANSTKDENLILAGRVRDYIEMHGGDAQICVDGNNIPTDCNVDIAIVLGGDGTMLLAASHLSSRGIPMIGINLGTMGFMADVDPCNMEDALDALLKDQYRIEERMKIQGKIYRDSKEMAAATALNDIVIARSGFSRIICLRIYVNGELLDVYEADGVIVATPTGSTGYNLSAGGPIISPKSKAVVVTPISPHSLTSKSVVFDSADRIRIEVVKKRRTQETEAIVSFDGADNIELSAGESVEVTCSKREIRLIKMYDVSFYSVLREKIGGA